MHDLSYRKHGILFQENGSGEFFRRIFSEKILSENSQKLRTELYHLHPNS